MPTAVSKLGFLYWAIRYLTTQQIHFRTGPKAYVSLTSTKDLACLFFWRNDSISDSLHDVTPSSTRYPSVILFMMPPLLER